MAKQYRISQEIKYLHIKKLKLNEQLYKLHLECSDKWPSTWPIILQNIDQKLTLEMESYYDNLNKKLDKLQNKQQCMRKTKTNQQHNQFYPRTVNLTKIKFNHEEMSLLNKGLQHSIEQPLEKYWTDLIMETEQAIRMLEPKMQSAHRILATRKLKQIKASSNHHNVEAKRTHILKKNNNKLRKEDAMITKADKGKTCVIIYNNDYANKVHNFLDNNNFQKLPKDPTDKYKKNHQYTKTLQLGYQQKTDEAPHPKETPTTLLKLTDQNTQTKQPY